MTGLPPASPTQRGSLRILHRGLQDFDLEAACGPMPGIVFVRAIDAAAVIAEVADSDALFLNAPAYTEATAAAACRPGSRLRWIQFMSSGTETASLHGVPQGAIVTNASSVWAPAVAEHGVALILGLCRQLHRLERDRAAARWDRPAILPHLASLEDQRIGLLGFGAIATAMAARLAPFGCHIVGFGRTAAARPGADEMHAIADLAAVAPTLSVLCSTLPLSSKTRGLVSAGILDRLAPQALVVNLGRGGTLDEAALAERLQTGRLAGAALDVFEPEPLPQASPLWALPNVIISPHVAAFGGTAGWRRLADLCRDNIARFQRGEALRNQVLGDR